MDQPLLRIRNLRVQLGDPARPVRAVDGVDLDIAPGETFALLGESGCGKSMTALAIMRLLPPAARVAEGSVELDGVSLLELPEQAMRRERGGRVGMIFQEPMTSLNPVMTVGEQIAEAVRIHDPDAEGGAGARVVELLQAVGIPDPERRVGEYPHQLSGGMKQRVMIAIALAGRPELLIADEPTTALDVTIQAQVLKLLRDLQRETGMAILLITHDLGVVRETADRVAVMYAGQIVESAPVERFFGSGQGHPYSRKLFDSVPGAAKRGKRLSVIRGSVPRLDQPFAGCRFADRCDWVEPACRESVPAWREPSPGHAVRCRVVIEAAVRPEASSSGAGPSGAPPTSKILRRTLLEVQDLKVHFPIQKGLFKRTVGQVRAVDGVSLAIQAGRTLALVGESGCGKTTVGKAILQLIRPTGGTARFEGDELTRMKGERLRRRRAALQIIFQDPVSSMNPRMLVSEIVAEGMAAQGLYPKPGEREKRVRSLLEQVGLSAEAADRYPHEFSGGQRQRICIARALAVNPRLIVCDEPTSALDVSVQAQILNLLKQLQDDLGISYLFITHNISVVSYLAQEVAVMYLGRIVERGRVEEVLESPKHPYTRALLAAVPSLEGGGGGTGREAIPGAVEMPSPANPPAGCHFHPRCPEVREECRSHYPAPRQLGETRQVSCHLYVGTV